MCTFCSDLGAAFATPYTKNRRGHKIKFFLKLCGSKMRIDRETITRWRIKPREYIGSFEIAFCPICGRALNRKDETNGRIYRAERACENGETEQKRQVHNWVHQLPHFGSQ